MFTVNSEAKRCVYKPKSLVLPDKRKVYKQI